MCIGDLVGKLQQNAVEKLEKLLRRVNRNVSSVSELCETHDLQCKLLATFHIR